MSCKVNCLSCYFGWHSKCQSKKCECTEQDRA